MHHMGLRACIVQKPTESSQQVTIIKCFRTNKCLQQTANGCIKELLACFRKENNSNPCTTNTQEWQHI